ncbi:MAG: CopG family transcriptional regulator [Bryobacteraceae bacterium]
MLKTTVYLDQDVTFALRQLSEAQGRSQAELIREALVNYTRGSARPIPQGVGKYSSGFTDTSERAEELLRQAATQGKWR